MYAYCIKLVVIRMKCNFGPWGNINKSFPAFPSYIHLYIPGKKRFSLSSFGYNACNSEQPGSVHLKCMVKFFLLLRKIWKAKFVYAYTCSSMPWTEVKSKVYLVRKNKNDWKHGLKMIFLANFRTIIIYILLTFHWLPLHFFTFIVH